LAETHSTGGWGLGMGETVMAGVFRIERTVGKAVVLVTGMVVI